MATLTIIRGLPGSGKTTLAKTIPAVHIETDMFFMINGEYCFDVQKLQAAHDWCLSQVDYHLFRQQDVVVSNTFVLLEHILPFTLSALNNAAFIKFIECHDDFGTTHNVPVHAIQRMKDRWEHLPKAWENFN